jgi:CRP-like cAMP-binding protein
MSAAIRAILEHPEFPRRKAWWKEDFGPQHTIIEEGDASRDVFFIESGVVRINKAVEIGPDQEFQSGLLELSGGDSFGELNLFGTTSRIASVIALSQTVLIHINGDALTQFMDRNPALGYPLLKEFFIKHADLLRQANYRLSGLYADRLRHTGVE